MLSCYIIDDELHAIKSLSVYIDKTPSLQLIGYNENPITALSHFQEANTYPDITFLDIDMPQISGIELSSILKGKTAIIFTTAHPEFAIEAFELDISDYLLKPFSYERFIKCISKISDLILQRRNKSGDPIEDFFYIQVEGKGKLIKVFFKDIIFIESQKNYLSIVTEEKKHLTYLTLTEIVEKLPASLLRISKSYIINTNKISHIEGNEIFLINKKESFIIGSSYKNAFSHHMNEHLIKTKRAH
ncbi:MAG: LytTR family DNA-binding domain-containing protein [Chitinophagaceae bacterium]